MGRKLLSAVVALSLLGALLVGCGASGDGPAGGNGGEETRIAEEAARDADFPPKDPAEPFALDEAGTVALRSDQAYTITVLDAAGEPLFVFNMKKTGVIDPEVGFTIQTIEPEMPEELTDRYVPVGEYAYEMHATGDTGYGFALRPELKLYFSDEDLAGAAEQGAVVDPARGNLLILYKEQRAPAWVPQMAVSVDEEARVVSLTNVAGSGAFWLVAKKAP
jgi:hypothetical protein